MEDIANMFWLFYTDVKGYILHDKKVSKLPNKGERAIPDIKA